MESCEAFKYICGRPLEERRLFISALEELNLKESEVSKILSEEDAELLEAHAELEEAGFSIGGGRKPTPNQQWLWDKLVSHHGSCIKYNLASMYMEEHNLPTSQRKATGCLLNKTADQLKIVKSFGQWMLPHEAMKALREQKHAAE